MKLLFMLLIISIFCYHLAATQLISKSVGPAINATINGNLAVNSNGILSFIPSLIPSPALSIQDLDSMLSEISILLTTITKQLQQVGSLLSSSAESGTTISLLLQVRVSLQYLLSSLANSSQDVSIMAREVEISTLLTNVNIALSLITGNISGPLGSICLPIVSLLNIVGTSQINTLPSLLLQVIQILSRFQ